MSNFDDLLKQPLPSKRYMTESTDLDDAEDSANDIADEMFDDDIEKLEDELGDIGDEDISDEDLLDGDEDETELDPEEEMHADDMMSIAATPILVDDELNTEEKEDFVS